MPPLAKRIIGDFTAITFMRGETFVWSPGAHTVQYEPLALAQPSGLWALLHEIGHAQLGHETHRDDLGLLMMEVAAWGEAKRLAARYGLKIDDHYVEHCLESYRIWLYKRSACLDCGTSSLQSSITTYRCHNCGLSWRVPRSKLCRVRRQRLEDEQD